MAPATEAHTATPATPGILATPEDFVGFGSNAELIQTQTLWTPGAVLNLMRRATVAIETRCKRRLAPFTKTETHAAYGISPDEYGEQGDLAMNLSGALGYSQAVSLGVASMVREFWLDESAPMYPELWTLTLQSVEILRTFGDTQTFSAADVATWQGPEVDTGHLKMPIGTYCPEGSTVRFTYSGGYTVGVPWDLNQATIFQAVKYVLLGSEPEVRQGMSTEELDDETLVLITNYVR